MFIPRSVVHVSCLLAIVATDLPAAEVRVEVDASQNIRVMRGGIGASWHAIQEPLDKWGGSGWGGTPPVDNANAWRQIERHADWLGLDWCRVEFEQRMYQPERGRFDWDNSEMRILYRILDWCESRRADVFLTQMWSNVAWNAFPEFRNSMRGVIHSGPASVEDFAEGLATLVEHLVKIKRYTCLRWLCITNEPGFWFRQPGVKPMDVSLQPALEAVRKALDRRGIDLPLSAPGVALTHFKPEKVDYLRVVGAVDLHTYDWKRQGLTAQTSQINGFAEWANQQKKPLFLSEFGTVKQGWRANHPGPGCFVSALNNASLIVRTIPIGVEGFSRWSFLNRGDLDGQWQLVDAWDVEGGKFLDTIKPHPNSYYFFGLLSRFTAKRSAVLSCRVEGGVMKSTQSVFAVALRAPRGGFTLAVVNEAPQAWDAAIQFRLLGPRVKLYQYEVSRADADRNDLAIEPKAEFFAIDADLSLDAALLPESLSIYTTFRLTHADRGITVED